MSYDPLIMTQEKSINTEKSINILHSSIDRKRLLD